MKRFGVALIALFALTAGALSVPSSAQATMTRGTSDWTLDVNPDAADTIILGLNTPSYYNDEDARDGLYVKVTGPVRFSTDWLSDWSSIDTGRSSIPRGVYTVTATYEEGGHWHCSQYNPNGCTWYPTERNVAKFKFRWDGSRVTVKPYRAAKTKLASKVGKKNKKTGRFVVKGRVTAQKRSASTFQPYGSLRRTKGVPIRIQMFDWDRYAWRTKKTVRTRADGTFSVKVTGSKKRPKSWRVYVVSSFEHASATPKKFKR